jgi:hypothetical protein
VTILGIGDSKFLQVVIERVLVRELGWGGRLASGKREGARPYSAGHNVPKLGGVRVLRALKNNPLTVKIRPR